MRLVRRIVARAAEESQFIVAARVHQHPAMTGLQRLSATDLKDTILQDKPPYSVLTEGHFRNLEEMGRRLFVTYGIKRGDDDPPKVVKLVWRLLAGVAEVGK